MRYRLHVILAASAIIFCVESGATANSFSITRWDLGTGIIDSFDTEGITSEMVQNPFIDEHHVSLSTNPLSHAHSYFDFSWTPDTASFLITASHIAFDDNSTRSASAGNIYITPSVDLLVSAQGHYDWDLPAGAMAIQWGFVAWDFQSHEVYFSQGDMHTTFLHGPASGTFTINGQGVLPPNRQIVLQYNMILDTFGNTGLLATGAGDILFTLQPVPEPSALALLAMSAAMFRRRRRNSLCVGEACYAPARSRSG